MKLQYILYILCLYVYLHNPDIPYLPFSLGTIKLMYIPMLACFLKRNKQYRDFMSSFRVEGKILLIVLFYVIIRTIMGGDVVELRLHLIGFIEIFFLPLWLILLARKSGLTNKDTFVKTILVVGAIGATISTITSFFPGIQDYIRNHFMHLKPDAFLLRETWRGRGISEALTSHYGFIQGCMLVLAAFHFKSNKWFLWFIPFTIISIIYNARTGLIIAVAGLSLLFFNRNNIKFLILLLIIGVFAFSHLESLGEMIGISDELTGSLTRFGDSLYAIYDEGGIDEDSGTVYELLVNMWILPDTLNEWIFGRGFSLFGMKDTLGFSSDVGFINNLAYGGLVYSMIMYSFLFIMLKRLWKLNEKRFFYFLIILFLIINIKTWFFPNVGTTRMIVLIYYFYVLYDLGKFSITLPNKRQI